MYCRSTQAIQRAIKSLGRSKLVYKNRKWHQDLYPSGTALSEILCLESEVLYWTQALQWQEQPQYNICLQYFFPLPNLHFSGNHLLSNREKLLGLDSLLLFCLTSNWK